MRRLVAFLLILSTWAVASGPAKASTVNAFVFGFSGSGAAPQLVLNGGAIVLSAVSTGWYDQNGAHQSSNPNYIVGQSGNLFYNDFFSFNLGAVTAPITSASLSIFNYSAPPFEGFSGSGPVLLTMWDVTTPYRTLKADQTTATGIYADLGGGILFGSALVGDFSNGTNVLIALNADAIAAINLALGGKFSFGGSLVPAPSDGNLPSVPIPGTLPLLLVAACIPWLLGATRRHGRVAR